MLVLLLCGSVLSAPVGLSKENESYLFEDPPAAKPATSKRVKRPSDSNMTDVAPDVLNERASSSGASANEPFKLNVEKLDSGTDETRLNAGTRLQRPVEMPPVAPPRLNAGVGALDTPQFSLNANTSRLDGLAVDKAFPTLKGGAAAIRPLADYDIELIIDQSLSMRTPDCPRGLSRWNWCGIQARELSSALAQVAPRGLTVTTFAGAYDVLKNAKPVDVEQLFLSVNFGLGTRLAAPLKNRLNDYIEHKTAKSRPLLIAVITDGVPSPRPVQPVMVADTLVNASKRIKDPKDITVVFFQIGSNDRFGKAFLTMMDHGLLRMGAHHDFVRTVDFDELQRVGLAQSLVDSVKSFAATNQKRLTPE